MKKLTAPQKVLNLVCLFLLFSLSTCKDKEPDPFSDGRPRIRSISFPSIPAQNVSIDQKNLVINVRMPEKLEVSNLKPTIEITDNARVSQLRAFSAATLCPRAQNYDHLEIELVPNTTANPSVTATRYKINFISTKPLALAPVAASFTFTLGVDREVKLPFLNLYGNPLPVRLRVTDLTTRDTVSAYGFTAIACSEELNHLAVAVGQLNLKPGSYRIDVETADKKFLTFAQTLTVQKGPAKLDKVGSVILAAKPTVHQNFTVEGINLFDGDIDLNLVDRQDKVLPIHVNNLEFEPNGRKITVKLPDGLPAGQYVLQMSQFKKLTPVCHRITIPADANNGLVLKFIANDYFTDCSIKNPVILPREQSVSLMYTESSSPYSRLKLTSMENSNMSYYVPIVPYPYDQLPPKITIPATIPVGRYTVSVQVLGSSTNQVLRESEPYGRAIELQ